MSKFLRQDKYILAFLLLVALVLRLDFLIPIDFVIDADEAIVGLMAKHIAEGQDIPTFYYGQHYMGSLEPLLVSLLFKLFGTSVIALKVVPLIFSLAFVILAYYLTLEIAGRFPALIAALLAAVPPSPLVVWSGKARGGFIEILVIGAFALLLCLRWLKPNRQTLAITFSIGLLLGFGWWTNNQIVYFMLPVGYAFLAKLLFEPGISLSLKIKNTFLHLLTGLISFLFGGLPYWIYNLQHDFASFEILSGSESSDVLTHVSGLFATSIPIILGSKRFWAFEDIFTYSTLLYYTAYAALILVILQSRRKQILNLFRFRLSENAGVEVFILFLIATFSVFTFSSYGYLVHAPRYLLPLYVAMFPLLAYSLELIRQKSKPVFASALVLILVLNILSSYSFGRSIPGEPFVFKQQRVSRDHTKLIEWLDAKKINWVRTNYWIGYRLAFETNERIKFDLFQEPNQLRIPSYRREAFENNIEEMPFVLVPAQAVLVQKAMKKMNYTFETEFVEGYQIVYNIQLPNHDFKTVDINLMTVHSNYKDEQATLAIDNNKETRWGSGHAQTPDMKFEIKLANPMHIVGVRYNLGNWSHDWPRALKVEVENSKGEVREVFDDRAYSAIRYYTEDNACFSMFFDAEDVVKVTLNQVSSGEIFDWSIAEIDLLQYAEPKAK